MNARKGYYSLIQYCPDASRLEAANVGVLLFRPEPHFIGAKTIRSSDRIRRFFGPDYDIDVPYLNLLKRGIEDAISIDGPDIRALDDLEAFIGGLANEVRITPPRPMSVTSPEAELDELLGELVLGRRASRPASKSGVKAQKALRMAFGEPALEPYLQRDLAIPLPALHEDWRVPYAYQNGRFNLVQPVDFGKTTAWDRAYEHAVAGRLIHDTENSQYGPLQLVVVAEFDPAVADHSETLIGLLEGFSVKVYPAGDLAPLVDDVLSHSSLPGV